MDTTEQTTAVGPAADDAAAFGGTSGSTPAAQERRWPLGAARCAELLAEATGLPVRYEDIETLADLGLLPVVDHYKGRPLYDLDAVDAVAGTEALAVAVAARQEWFAASMSLRDAAARLGWTDDELTRETHARDIAPGRWGRYARADVEALAADTDLCDRLRRVRTVDAERAAEVLEVRRVELDHLVAAGLIRPVHRAAERCPDDRADVSVGLFNVGDLEDLREIDGIDWETVRGVRPGRPSPLRELMPALPTRAERIRALADRVTTVLGVPVTAVWHEPRSRRRDDGWWEYTWPTDPTGAPTAATVARAIRDDQAGSRYRREIQLTPAKNEH
ncbi:hypothetical protein [Micromonospora sp. CPCC 206061]|uniref:hypothetical protein n=1 Tax=Micromonospora sp. CPCC 206061 TaxID=3122410 RepID=UPI002FF2A38E